jgi:hypothetical protein
MDFRVSSSQSYVGKKSTRNTILIPQRDRHSYFFLQFRAKRENEATHTTASFAIGENDCRTELPCSSIGS